MKRFIIVIWVCLLSLPALAEDKNPIDLTEKTCLSGAISTTASIQCATNAYNAWSDELTRYLKLLNDNLSEQERQEFTKIQAEWMKFKTDNTALLNKTLTQKEGTIYPQLAIEQNKNLVKQRVINLKIYYEIITDKYLNR